MWILLLFCWKMDGKHFIALFSLDLLSSSSNIILSHSLFSDITFFPFFTPTSSVFHHSAQLMPPSTLANNIQLFLMFILLVEWQLSGTEFSLWASAESWLITNQCHFIARRRDEGICTMMGKCAPTQLSESETESGESLVMNDVPTLRTTTHILSVSSLRHLGFLSLFCGKVGLNGKRQIFWHFSIMRNNFHSENRTSAESATFYRSASSTKVCWAIAIVKGLSV